MYRYCGPWWSDGRYQLSVENGDEPYNELDGCCKAHDNGWYGITNYGYDPNDVDLQFEQCADKHGTIGKAMALAVKTQRNIRTIFTRPAGENMVKNNVNLRGAAKKVVKTKQQSTDKSVNFGTTQLSAPAAISSVLTSQPTRTKTTSRGILVTGKEFIGTVEGQGVSTFGVGKSALISPAFFYGGILGNLARCYSKYVFKRILIHYIPKVSTNLSGQVVICSSSNVTMPCLRPESNTFLQRALVSGNGVMGPIWAPLRMQIKTDTKPRYVNAFTNSDIDENVFCEVQVLTQVGTSQQTGFLWMEYECELIDNVLEPHSIELPIAQGPGSRVSLIAVTTTPTAGSPVVLGDTAGILTTSVPGTIYRFVLDIQGSLPPGGTTFANAWAITTMRQASTTSASGTTTPDTLVGGMTVYLVVYSSTLTVYTSLENAISGVGSGQFMWSTTGSTTGAFVGDATLVRVSLSTINDVQ